MARSTKQQAERRRIAAAVAQEVVRLRDKAATLDAAGLKASAESLRRRAADLEKRGAGAAMPPPRQTDDRGQT